MKKDPQDSLTQRLEGIVGEAKAVEGYTMGAMIEGLGKRGYGLLLIILALPSALPVPAPGYSTPFGLAIIMVAIGLMSTGEKIALPRKIKEKTLNVKLLEGVIKKGSWILGMMEAIIKPRMEWICRGRALVFIGVMIIVLAGIMAMPIPLTNTAPAAVIFCLGVGLLENDGYWVAGFMGIGVVLVAVYAGALYIGITYGVEALVKIKEQIIALF